MLDMENQSFRKEDIEKYEIANIPYKGSEACYTEILYKDESLKDIEIPVALFEAILYSKRFNKHLSEDALFSITIDKMEMNDNWWWKDEPCMWMGDKDGNGTLLINPDKKDELHTLRLLATMLGGFRWKMLIQNENLKTVVHNANVERWFEWMEEKSGASRNTLNHVFFEVTPYAIACKLFACELLDIPYVSGKFTITDETLGFINLK